MKLRLCFFLLIFSVSFYGQDYVLKKLQVRDERNNSLINSPPFTDKDGFVWFSVNKEGVFFRFDGKNKIEYNYYKKDIPPRGPLYCWTQDSNNNIWAIDGRGVYIISPASFTIKRIPLGRKSQNYVISVFKDSRENIWINTGLPFITRFDKKYRQKKFYISESGQKDGKILEAVKELKDGSILAKSDLGLFLIKNDKVSYFGSAVGFDKKIRRGFRIAENGQLFPAGTSGIYKFNSVPYPYCYIKEFDIQLFNWPLENFLFRNSMIVSSDYFNAYLNVVDPLRSTITTTDTLKFSKPIMMNRLSTDSNNTIWFSTYNEIFMLKAANNLFKKYLFSTNIQVSTRGIVSDSKGNIYIGCYAGLLRIDAGTRKATQLYNENESYPEYFNSMIMENDSVMWYIGETAEVSRTNLLNNTTKSFVQKQKQDNYYTVFLKEKSKDSLWLGTTIGLFTFDKKSHTITEYPDSKVLFHNTVTYDLLKAKNGNIWLATDKGLLLKQKGKPFIYYNQLNKSFKYKGIVCLQEDTAHRIWVGTVKDGVIMIDPKTGKIKVYNQSNGLSNNSVCGLLESNDALWISTFYGLSRLDKTTERFNNFYEENGLSDNEFNYRSFYKYNDSTFYFGGLNGVVGFNPEKSDGKRKGYKIFLSQSQYYSAEKKKIVRDYTNLDGRTIELPYDRNFFSADFAINDLFYKDKDTYSYKIDGLTNGWINLGTSRSVNLYGLPAGDYVLCVKGRDFQGFATANEIKINIHVQQVFFKTPLFVILIIVLCSLFIVYEFRRKARKQRRIFEKEKEIIRLKANALKAQMNPHFVFNILNNMQSIMILKGEVEVNKYFVAFSRLLRLTLDMSNEEQVSLREEIEYIRNYLLLNNLQMNQELQFTVTVDESIDSTKIHIPGMLIQPFVENAIIHGLIPKNGDKRLDIRFYMDGKYLVVTIDDNGIGRAAAGVLGQKRTYAYKSWSTSIVSDRMKIFNAAKADSVVMEIIDKEIENKPVGTTVILKFFLI